MTLIKTAFFAAPPPIVWSFLTDAKKLGTWYYAAEADLAVGEDYKLVTTDEDGNTSVIVSGRVLEMTPHSRLVTTFSIAPFGGKETTLIWQLEDTLGGTRLQLEHSGIDTALGDAALPLFQALDAGWDKHIAKLRKAVDN